jgi:benzaldehyde dehydrogenase (NAD)
MQKVQLLIDGKNCDGSTEKVFTRKNPLSGEIATMAVAATVSDAKLAVEAASIAFPAWSALGPNARRSFLLKVAEILEAKTPQFIEAMGIETGASSLWAGFNAHLASGMLQEAAAITTQLWSASKSVGQLIFR